MADYAEMYRVLFRATTKAIMLMQEAQRMAEEIYISGDEPVIKIFPSKGCNETDDGDYSK